ncbi:MAG: zinc-dependent metalloprotease family protein [Saprospiraceae bacterium]
MKQFLSIILILQFCVSSSTQSLWKQTMSKPTLISEENINVQPSEFKLFQLDYDKFQAQLRTLTNNNTRNTPTIFVDIPNELGQLDTYEVWESSVLEHELAGKYPNIKSYKGTSTTDKHRRIWFTTSIQGFYAAIIDGGQEIYIDPYSIENNNQYVVYNTQNNHSSGQLTTCGVEDEDEFLHQHPSERSLAGQVEKRTYKLAMACTGEWGAVARRGTVEKCLADINTMVTRMNSIYETELAVSFTIINDNDKLIFLDPDTDPYTDSDKGKSILGGNTTILSNLLGGTSGFQIGHVLSICFDIGGVAQLGSLCRSNKGNGVTCNNNNDLSNIVTRVMAHEVGHQFSASHTWNRCEAYTDQRASSTAVEPGSGTTIMSYAGSCSSDNVAGDNDAYFHNISLEQMRNYTTGGVTAHTCAEKELLDNHFPEIDLPSGTYVVPISTPFSLNGTATDEDGDNLTYCWEQIDTGPELELGTNTAVNGPLFRSTKPSTSGIRYFPSINDIVTGKRPDSEALPSVSRDINLRLTVRDNNPIGAGIVWEDYKFSFSDQAGPFEVTYPQATQNFKFGDKINVTWNVANTDKAPINTKFVNIYGSINSALNDSDPNLILLMEGTPNDGSQDVIIPNRETRFFRIVIKAVDNIFLNSSYSSSRIDPPTTPTVYFDLPHTTLNLCQPAPFEIELNTTGYGGLSDSIHFELEGLPSGVIGSFSKESVLPGEKTTLNLNTENLQSNFTGNIVVKAFAKNIDTLERLIFATFKTTNLNSLELTNPIQGASGENALPTFEWNDIGDAESYDLEVATNPSFESSVLIFTKNTEETQVKSAITLEKAKIYFWRVRGKNSCKDGDWSSIHAFVTEAQSCSIQNTGDNQINITSSGTPSVTLPLAVNVNGTVNDLNIPKITMTHSRVSDLVVTLIAPSGKSSVLWSKKCPTGINVNVGLDDQAPKFFACPINTGNIYKPDIALSNFNGENALGEWILKVDDTQSGGGGQLISFELEICSNVVLDQPYIATNNTLEMYPTDTRQITKSLLEILDNNNTSQEIKITIVTLPNHGQLQFNDNVITIGTVLTQKDINDGLLSYKSLDNFEGSDGFDFLASDELGGWVPITRFEIDRNSDFPSGTLDELSQSALHIYPNPVNEKLTLSTQVKGNIKVYNSKGQEMESVLVQEGISSLNTNNWDKGIYLIQLISEGKTISKKVVKM